MAWLTRRAQNGAVALRVAAIALLLAIMAAAAAVAQPAPAQDAPPKVRELLQLLSDPAVQSWIEEQRSAKPGAAPAPEDAASPSSFMANRALQIRQHIHTMIMTVPQLPSEFSRGAEILARDLKEGGLIRVIAWILVFTALGFGAEWLFGRATSGAQRWLATQSPDSVKNRLRAIVMRLALAAGRIACFAAGSVGLFLVLAWPPLLHLVVFSFLMAGVILRLALAMARFLLAPDAEPYRIIPATTEAARFWVRRIGWFIGWYAYGYVLVHMLDDAFGFSRPAQILVAYLLGLGLVVIALETTWRRPISQLEEATRTVAVRRAIAVALSIFYIALWLLWIVSAMRLFWVVLFAAMLPLALRVTRRGVAYMLRPATTDDAGLPPIYSVGVARAANAGLIICAAVLLAHLLGLDLGAMAARDTLATRLARGFFSAVVIVLIADLAWHIIRAIIDNKLAGTVGQDQPDPEEVRRRQRLRTLLPILRNILYIVFIVMTLLMVLAAMGVEIGPLVAGAGVVGVAIGFGAQTLVRDVISGMFYLLDDAFRVGEYIQSGNYKGTVESFSLRSVKLRHHRGPLYTVPFGQLGAVQNMSRDWVIDKMMVSVTYDSDLTLAKKLIKQIGKDLAAIPEYAPDIIEPMKMQGIDQFGDYAIQIRMKMTTKPGQQFTIRRRALAMIKQAFDANGIKFATPTVQVASNTPGAAVAAAAAMELHKAEKPAAE